MVKQAENSSTVKENICEDAMNALSNSGVSFQGASHFTVSFHDGLHKFSCQH